MTPDVLPQFQGNKPCPNLVWNNNVELVPFAHGQHLPFEYTNAPEIAKKIRGITSPLAVGFDNLTADAANHDSTWTQESSPYMIQVFDALKPNSDILVAGDFVTEWGDDQLVKEVALFKDLLGVITLVGGGLGLHAVYLARKFIEAQGNEKLQKQKLSRRTFILGSIFGSVAGISGTYGIGITSANIQSAGRIQALTSCSTNTGFSTVSGITLDSGGDAIERTFLTNEKMSQIPESEFINRGVHSPQRQFIWGSSHLEPGPLNSARSLREPKKLVEHLLSREIKFHIGQNVPEKESLDRLSDLLIKITGVLFLRPTRQGDGSFKLTAVQDKEEHFYWFNKGFDPFGAKLDYPDPKGKATEIAYKLRQSMGSTMTL